MNSPYQSTKKNPLARYKADLEAERILPDPLQAEAIRVLDQLYTRLFAEQNIWCKFKKWFGFKTVIKSLYLWGPVGSGKTYLMDTFCHSLPNAWVQRQHFQEFMRFVHQELIRYQGQQDPLARIAQRFAKKTKVLCFDEFFVEDIGDAMLLGNLLKRFFSLGLILVTTSNSEPSELYKNGLLRERFMPTIALLEEYCDIIEVNNEIDYRLCSESLGGAYFWPLNEASSRALTQAFERYSKSQPLIETEFLLNGRSLKVLARTADVLKVDFAELCYKPQAGADYLSLAAQFHTIIVANVPIMSADNENSAKRFIKAIDVFYNQKIRLIISANADIENLYQGRLLKEDFKRTASRLYEMTHSL